MNPAIKESSRPRVLIVDDQPANLDILVAHLQQEFCELVVALSGEEGLQLAREIKPDLILLDVMMPGMDGFETCRRLKDAYETSDIPVIFLSAKDDSSSVIRGLKLGGIDYVSKPFSMPVLKQRVRNHLSLKHNTDQLTKLACMDELTNIANRRHFDRVFKAEWERALRNKNSLSLMMVDVDHFKLFNDRYGHLEGDRCLRSVANALKEALRRPADLLARFGGEEFVVLLPESSGEGAEIVAQRLHESVAALNIAHAETRTGKLSISVGWGSVQPKQSITSQDLLRKVDAVLYEAKKSGRNCVCRARI